MKIIETIALTESDLHGRSRSVKKYSKENEEKIGRIYLKGTLYAVLLLVFSP